MIRVLAMIGGVSGAIGLSQFPEFSQQYYQRLSGAVDELRVVAVGFDFSARAAGLTRDEALSQLSQSGAFQTTLGDTMAQNLARYDQLSAAQTALSEATVLQRLSQPWRFSDTELAARTWHDFKPAVPVTMDGLICAGIGYVAGWGLVAGVLGGIRRVLRRVVGV